MQVMVTGATGFVGRALCDHLIRQGVTVVGAVRKAEPIHQESIALAPSIKWANVGEINHASDWMSTVQSMDAVVHLAARVHMMRDNSADPLGEFREVNTEGTLNLARQAAEAGVKRFVFLSSIKVNGEETSFRSDSKDLKRSFREDDEAAPQDAYAISKWEAELGLMQLGHQTGMEIVILRPPLVYGPGVGANFFRLMRAVDRGVPLPLGAVENHRSLIYLGNLVDAITVCLNHPLATGKTYLISDGEAISTQELVRRIAKAFDLPAHLLSIPPNLMLFVGKVLGKRKEIDRLLGSLVLEDSAIRRELAWKPPFSMQEGLEITIAWYRKKFTQ